jgi:AmpE protein
MILIALLIAFSIERVVHLPAFWQMDFLLARWLDWSQQKLSPGKQQQLDKPVAQAIWLLLPALLAGLLVTLLDNSLVTFIAGIIALLVGMSCPDARSAYKNYLKAANKGDHEAVAHYQQQLNLLAGSDASRPINQTVCWLNYQYYVAVMFFYVVFGVFGVFAYAAIRSAELHQSARFNSLPLQRLRWALDFIPVRLAGLGLLIVGHFSRALPVWLSSLTDLRCDQRDVLAAVVDKAEDMPHHPDDKTDAAGAQLKLMKRQQIVWLCVIALMTLSGGLY